MCGEEWLYKGQHWILVKCSLDEEIMAYFTITSVYFLREGDSLCSERGRGRCYLSESPRRESRSRISPAEEDRHLSVGLLNLNLAGV